MGGCGWGGGCACANAGGCGKCTPSESSPSCEVIHPVPTRIAPIWTNHEPHTHTHPSTNTCAHNDRRFQFIHRQSKTRNQKKRRQYKRREDKRRGYTRRDEKRNEANVSTLGWIKRGGIHSRIEEKGLFYWFPPCFHVACKIYLVLGLLFESARGVVCDKQKLLIPRFQV